MNRRNAVFGAAMLTALALVATGCTTTAEAPTAKTDTIHTTIDVPASFDPTLTASLPDFVLARTSYDTLVRRDDSGLVPGLAAEWTATPTSATFTIRKGATCSDGTEITPTIVKNSLEYFARPDSPSTQVVYTFGPGNTPKITADDAAGTVTITLSAPWPYLVDAMSVSSTGIICPAGLADPKGLGAGTVKGSESGPYVLSSFKAGVSYDYTLRDDYDAWPKWTTDVSGTPAKHLVYTVSPDSTATANLILSGQMDIGKIQAQTMDRFTGQKGYDVSVNRFSDFYLIFNERKGSPFADEAARKAVVQAIDRAMFEKVTSIGTGELSTSLASSQTQCVGDATTPIPDQDVAAATAELKGMTIRFAGPNIVGAAGAGNEYIAEALRNAGATVKLTNTDVGSWISTVITQPESWDVTLFADLNFIGSLASPLMNFIGPTPLDGGSNFGSIDNAKMAAAFTAANTATSDDDRCAALNDAVGALIERADTLPLVNDAFIYASRPGFSVRMLGGALDDPLFRIQN